jgi:hypothetical protein
MDQLKKQINAAAHTGLRALNNEHLAFYTREFFGTADDPTMDMLSDRLNAGMLPSEAVVSMIEGE